jgi:hypothetical protein
MEENKRNTKYLYLKISLQETLKIFWKRITPSQTVLSDICLSTTALSPTVRQIALLLRQMIKETLCRIDMS